MQLRVAQQLLTRCRAGHLRLIFATDEEWLAYHQKDQTGTLQFARVTPEHMAEDVRTGYVWLDYSSVPQAAAAEEARLRAIDSIPFYVDHASTFIALVPRVEHVDLPGTFCDYKSWTERGCESAGPRTLFLPSLKLDRRSIPSCERVPARVHGAGAASFPSSARRDDARREQHRHSTPATHRPLGIVRDYL